MWNPKHKVWENIYKADFFIEKAKDSDIPVTWCIEIVAESLWSAIAILKEKELKLGGGPTDWFKKNGLLVYQIRNGTVHYNPPTGIGQTFSPPADADADADGIVWHAFGSREGEGDTVRTHVWIRENGKAQPHQIPIEQVLDELMVVAERVKQGVMWTTGESHIPFVP